MRCNQAGVNLIKSFESCKLSAYLDGNGIPSIGWGHTGPEVHLGLVWTQDQSDSQFLLDLAQRAEAPVNNLVTVALTSNQFSALCCFVFNIGSGNFRGSSALHLLNAGNYKDVPAHIMLWDEVAGHDSNGLIRRRKAEINLWNTGDSV